MALNFVLNPGFNLNYPRHFAANTDYLTRYPSYRVLATPEFEEWFKSLPENDKRRRWVLEMKGVLAENRIAGQQVTRDRIPPKYLEKYDLKNLYRYQHPEGCRSVYTLLNDGDNRVSVIVLGLFTHNEYDDLFGYD